MELHTHTCDHVRQLKQVLAMDAAEENYSNLGIAVRDHNFGING